MFWCDCTTDPANFYEIAMHSARTYFMEPVGSFSTFQHAKKLGGPGYQGIDLLYRLLFQHVPLDQPPDLIFIWLGTWNQPAWKRDAQQEYLDKHIDTAVRFNISDISDKQSSAPLMLPPPQQFEEQVGKVHILLCLPTAYLVHQCVCAWWNTCIMGPCFVAVISMLLCFILYSLYGLV